MSNKPVTLKDVAQLVGVSINTASCVLNPRTTGKKHISPETRSAIMKAARKLGYRRNNAAARLVGCRTRILGLLMPSLTNPLIAPIADAFEERAAELGYQCFVGCTRFRGLSKIDYVEQFLSNGVDGLLLTTVWNDPDVEHALRMVLDVNMPVVFIDYMWEERPAPLICGNHFEGGQLLARHLLEVGHARMAFLCDEAQRSLRSINERIRGVQQVLAECGNAEAKLNLLWSPYHRATDFARTVSERLQQPLPPTVILCSGDLTAIELCAGLASRGIQVPRDLCVTGYDDLLNPFVSRNLQLDGVPMPWRFPFTTVRQPTLAIGRKAAEVLIAQIESQSASKGEEYLMPVELVTGPSSIPAVTGVTAAGR